MALAMRVISPCSGAALCPFAHGCSQFRLVGARLAELLRELLVIDARRLFLQAQLADPVTERLEFLLRREPGFLGRAQPACGLLLPVAGRRQRLLAGNPVFQPFLQLRPQRRVVDAGELGLKLVDLLRRATCLLK